MNSLMQMKKELFALEVIQNVQKLLEKKEQRAGLFMKKS